ncbi:putative fungistatic metabolite [Staphylotrichum tortipilum]|uniref:Fungistatic metabolite n=1 Tax=Staphylotrichum tortipilum TaxID=2831512 RepID=A0AAN6MRW0_9PEZI|nr:putative fungistatic metabolite [Staphylotrichum longicolle]
MRPLLPTLLLATLTLAQSPTSQTPKVEIITSPSSGYTYHGCYNETTNLPDTAGVRALGEGAVLVAPGNMTVETCWAFCKSGAGDSKGGTGGRFKFAGLEYARECWCAQSISSLSQKVADGECNLPCEGNTTQACGGNLKITVYQAGAAAARVQRAAGLIAAGAMVFTLV